MTTPATPPPAAPAPAASPEPEAQPGLDYAAIPRREAIGLVGPPPPSASIATHPNAVSPAEGLLAVPQDRVIVLLNKVLKLKYTAIITYMNYGHRLMAHFRDSIAEHFNDHIEDEVKGAYELARKITAWGGSPVPAVGKVPDLSELHAMITQLMTAEAELLEAERAVLEVVGNNVALRVFTEELMVTDNHHLDDMRRLLFCGA